MHIYMYIYRERLNMYYVFAQLWLSPACQVRVVRFYVSCPAFSRLLLASARSQWPPRLTRTASPGSEWPLQALDHSGPRQTRTDRSAPRRTRTASPGSECSPPDPNCKLAIAVVPAWPEQQPPDESDPRQTSTTKNLRRYIKQNATKNTRKNARKSIR